MNVVEAPQAAAISEDTKSAVLGTGEEAAHVVAAPVQSAATNGNVRPKSSLPHRRFSPLTESSPLSKGKRRRSFSRWVPMYRVRSSQSLGATLEGRADIAERLTIQYAAPDNFVGRDQFTYTLTDTTGQRASAWVFVTLLEAERSAAAVQLSEPIESATLAVVSEVPQVLCLRVKPSLQRHPCQSRTLSRRSC